MRAHGSGKWGGRKAYNLMSNGNDENETSKYHNYILGYNSRLDAIQASILNVKMKYIDEWNSERVNIANRYNEGLRHLPIKLPFIAERCRSVYHLYTILLDDRDELFDYLMSHGISSGKYYSIPLHLQLALSKFGYHYGDFPVAEELSKKKYYQFQFFRDLLLANKIISLGR